MIIYVDKITARVRYALDIVLNGLIGTDFRLTENKDEFMQSEDAKLSYTDTPLCNEVFVKRNSNLLFEMNVIQEQNIILNSQNEAFDLFAAAFWCAVRYEEYLPFDIDEHGRYSSDFSLLFKEGLLQKPVVNLWANELKQRIVSTYPNLPLRDRKFGFINSIDVDSIFAFRGRKLWISIGGLCRDLLIYRNMEMVRLRIKTLLRLIPDPFDTFNFITDIAKTCAAKTIFFFLVGERSPYDKNININNKAFKTIIRKMDSLFSVGIHPSYVSNSKPEVVENEIKKLSNVIDNKPIKACRFHFVRFRLPESFNVLIKAGITDDYSMGYADKTGFRSGLCTPYPFYDLQQEKQTNLIIHPFSVMDMTLQTRMSREKSLEQIKRLIDEVHSVNGEMITLFHNQNLAEITDWKGWQELYKEVIEYAQSKIS
ncbi:MAG: polysaccharide deacetylase family protein [Bacteroidales bacterium]|jgi:hypothetical protein|nr:polysaccharide deacetylase family protein [Bacteroidales bacterium]